MQTKTLEGPLKDHSRKRDPTIDGHLLWDTFTLLCWSVRSFSWVLRQRSARVLFGLLLLLCKKTETCSAKPHEVLVWKNTFLRIPHEDCTIPSCWNNGLIFSKHQTRTEASNYPACWMARSANFFSMVRERPSLVRCQLSWEFVHPAGILKMVRSRNGHSLRTCFKIGIHFEWWWFWTKLLVLG